MQYYEIHIPRILGPTHGLGMNLLLLIDLFILFPYFVTLAFVCDSVP